MVVQQFIANYTVTASSYLSAMQFAAYIPFRVFIAIVGLQSLVLGVLAVVISTGSSRKPLAHEPPWSPHDLSTDYSTHKCSADSAEEVPWVIRAGRLDFGTCALCAKIFWWCASRVETLCWILRVGNSMANSQQVASSSCGRTDVFGWTIEIASLGWTDL